MRTQRRLYLSTLNAPSWAPRTSSQAVASVFASYTRFLTATGKGAIPEKSRYRKSRDTGTVGIPEHCVFGGVHRPRKRFAEVDLDISSATAGKDVSRALHARERLLQLSFQWHRSHSPAPPGGW